MFEGDFHRRYRENPKHKRGCSGEGPPRWFPTRDSLCPEDLSLSEAEALLDASVEGRDDAHPNSRARFAIDGQGRFFKGYSEDGGRTWHGYPIRRDLVSRQVPARVLKEFVNRGLLARSDYKKLLGSAS
jgi:hypothetical protein